MIEMKIRHLSGVGNDRNVTLVATTATQIPEVGQVPVYPYHLVVYNSHTTLDVFIRFTSGNTIGFKLAANGGEKSFNLERGEIIWVYSSGAATLNYSTKNVGAVDL